jgi:hypothetical protein
MARPSDYTLTGMEVGAIAAQDYWNLAWYKQFLPEAISDVIVPDHLPGAPADYYYNAVNAREVAAFWSTYQSTLVPIGVSAGQDGVSERNTDLGGRPDGEREPGARTVALVERAVCRPLAPADSVGGQDF